MPDLRRLCALIAGSLIVPGLTSTGAPAQAATTPSTPYTWGGNSYGQLGDGTTVARLSAGRVDLPGVIDVHGGREHVITLLGDGTVWTWGSNVEGQLGSGSTGNRSLPGMVPGLTGVVAVETGHNHSMALRGDGTVWSWGLNSDGQLGDGTTTLRRSPVRVVGLAGAVAIAAGRNMSFALLSSGEVMGWGRNDEGQVGDGTTVRRLTPVRVALLTDVRAIAGGRDHGLAVRGDGSVWVWGSNDYGQVGNGTVTDRLTPVQVISSGVSDVAAGAHHSYALRSNGTVASWGRNYRAELGDGTLTQRTRPVAVTNVSGAVTIGSLRDAGVVTLQDGRAMSWGHNLSGQLGDGTTTNRTTAIFVPGVANAVKSGGGGSAYAVILQTEGPPPSNIDPVARVTGSCTGLSCSFSGASSSDQDGTITGYDWDFGDGGTAEGVSSAHTFAAPGTYLVTLRVTDDDGATNESASSWTVDAEPASTIAFRAAASADGNSTTARVTVPAAVRSGDRLVLFVSIANTTASVSTPAGWTLLGTVTDSTDLRSLVLTRVATTTTPGGTAQANLGATSKWTMSVTGYSGAGAVSAVSSAAEEAASVASHAAPPVAVAADGSTVLRFWVDKTSTPHGWTIPADLVQRTSSVGSGGGMLSSVLGDTAGVPAGMADASVATAGVASGKAVAWSVAVSP